MTHSEGFQVQKYCANCDSKNFLNKLYGIKYVHLYYKCEDISCVFHQHCRSSTYIMALKKMNDVYVLNQYPIIK